MVINRQARIIITTFNNIFTNFATACSTHDIFVHKIYTGSDGLAGIYIFVNNKNTSKPPHANKDDSLAILYSHASGYF